MTRQPVPIQQMLRVGPLILHHSQDGHSKAPADHITRLDYDNQRVCYCVTDQEESTYIYIDLSDLSAELMPSVGSTVRLQVQITCHPA